MNLQSVTEYATGGYNVLSTRRQQGSHETASVSQVSVDGIFTAIQLHTAT